MLNYENLDLDLLHSRLFRTEMDVARLEDEQIDLLEMIAKLELRIRARDMIIQKMGNRIKDLEKTVVDDDELALPPRELREAFAQLNL